MTKKQGISEIKRNNKPENLGKILDLLKPLLYPISLVFVAVSHHLICGKVNYNFIDEKFHIPQAIEYCKENFSHWDDKITTPPGLYLLAYAYKSIINLTPWHIECDIQSLRSLNTIGGSVVLPLILSSSVTKAKSDFWMSNVVLVPLITIYFNLFYTDIWSTVYILSSFTVSYTCPFGFGFANALAASTLGFLSIWFRQTNIIWIAYNLAVFVDQKIKDNKGYEQIKTYEEKYSLLHLKGFFAKLQLQSSYTAFVHLVIFFETVVANFLVLIPFFTNFILFAVFLILNGGITFGDKKNHVSTVHIPQVYYCILFMGFFGWPILVSISSLSSVLKRSFGSVKAALQTVLIYLVMFYTIHEFTVVHPFLLADNRHYTFYLWRRVIDYNAYLRFAMIPLYHLLGLLIIETFNASTPTLLAYIFCVCVSLIPSPLFEPRYYILPYLYWRTFAKVRPVYKEDPRWKIYLEYAWSLGLNSLILYVFLNVEFPWATESEPQRIIW